MRFVLAIAAIWACASIAPALAKSKPGQGVVVTPVMGMLDESFQTRLVVRGLTELGYRVRPALLIEDYGEMHRAVASGRATFMACHWDPLHGDAFYEAGGDEAMHRKGFFVPGSIQGYQVDRRSAIRLGIDTIDKLSNPDVAAAFDHDGDGKADLVGCPPGWSCGDIIEHHLDAFGLRETVTHHRTDYGPAMSAAIGRFEAGKPVLFYAYTPHWSNGRLVPGRDAIWLLVPFSALPNQRPGATTAQPDGSDFGFRLNRQRIVANRDFARKHPAAARLFELMRLPAHDISAQNAHFKAGERSAADIERHVDGWVTAHRATFDDWLDTARRAARRR